MRKKTKKYLIFIIVLGGIFILNISTFAHPGRTDSRGCHTCRTNCPSWGLSYGEYHCHRAKALPQPEPPIESHRGFPEGYTEPAPEYEAPVPREESSTPKKYTAEIPKEDSGGSIFWWIIGIGFVGYLFYQLVKKIRKK